jgi:transposase
MAWYPIGTYLHDRGVSVYRVNGIKTRDLRKVYQRHAGSDRIDSQVLAHLYAVMRGRLIRWQPPSAEQLALQRACREFGRWRELAVAIQNRLDAYDQWAWNGLRHWMPPAARDWMQQHWYDPWQVQAAGVTTLQEAWEAAAPEQPAAVDWIPAWVERAATMKALYGTPERVGYASLQKTLQRNLAFLAQARQVRKELSRTHMQPLYRRLCPDRWLETLQGVGADSAAIYIAFIMDINRFPRAACLRSWSGIVPRSRQSGYFEAKGLSITKAGPNLIKATLYLNANVARQWDAQFAALYYRLVVERGKHHTVAVCACASHLVNRIYALLKEQRPYQLRDVDNRPLSPQESRELCLTRYRVPEEVRERQRVHARRQRREQRAELRFLQLQPF